MSLKKKRKLLKKHFHKWVEILGLSWWHGELIQRSNMEPSKDGNHVFARCYVDWKYLDFSVEVDLSVLWDTPDEDIESLVVHELCHVLVNEMRNYDLDHGHEERVVTGLQKAFMWVRDLK